MCLANSITVVAQSLANAALPTFISAVRTTNTTSEATARKGGRAIRREHGVREVDGRETGTVTGKCIADPLKCSGHEIDVL